VPSPPRRRDERSYTRKSLNFSPCIITIKPF
jgi:hypothetical protein